MIFFLSFFSFFVLFCFVLGNCDLEVYFLHQFSTDAVCQHSDVWFLHVLVKHRMCNIEKVVVPTDLSFLYKSFTLQMLGFLLLRQPVYDSPASDSFFLFLSFFPSILHWLTLHWGQTEDCISMLHGTEDLDTIWFRGLLGSISTWPAHCLGSFCGCQFRALTWITMLNQWDSGILPKASKR